MCPKRDTMVLMVKVFISAFLFYPSGSAASVATTGETCIQIRLHFLILRRSKGGVGGTVDGESALRSVGTFLSRVRVPPPPSSQIGDWPV
ncbi:hypothetical protein PoB_003673100 [Plakobranchus ocellatus]|uniref:Secreted protein n=1 Tax=Plakobranchus ocellatus TaxID=259542 RepID=A0AAV4AGB7_9GAST|nr:hypothetical protein PoB_003673100 [Plakobranchus ocellatus]